MGTLRRFAERIARLYEQDANYLRIGQYVRCWFQWVWSGISEKRTAKTRKAGAMKPLPLGNAVMMLVLLLSASDADSCKT